MLSHKRKNNHEKSESFLVKLFEILKVKQYHIYITWTEDGNCLKIKDMSGLTKKILPKYFKHHNYASFVRQLNMYNFHKLRNQGNFNEQIFQHEKFKKGCSLENVKQIKRKIYLENSSFDEDEITNSKQKKNKKEEENISLKNQIQFLINQNKENIEIQNNLKKEIEFLTKKNDLLNNRLDLYNQKLIYQSDENKKMKGLIQFIILFLRAPQNQKKENSQNLFKNLIYKYVIHHLSKEESPTDSHTLTDQNENNIVEHGENFSINNNDLFFNDLSSLKGKAIKLNENNIRDDISYSSLPTKNLFDIDLSLVKNNNSSFSIFNNSINNNMVNLNNSNFCKM
jgi:hypothetical protein